MNIIYRAEINNEAHEAYNYVSLKTEAVLAEQVAQTSLRDIAMRIRYIPIIMTEEWRKRYPARSRLERKNRIYNCCPQLPIEPFLTGTKVEQFTVYINGLRECGPALKKLGATDDQVAEFDRALDETLESLVSAA